MKRTIFDEDHEAFRRTCAAFVDRKLVEKVRYAKQKGIKEVGMISNGSLITEAVARGMVDAGLDAINISVDASGKDVFESTRIGLKYDKVIANIERLVRIRAESGKRRPKLILSFVRQNNSADEQAFIEHWRRIADKIHITDLHNWGGTLHQESGQSSVELALQIEGQAPFDVLFNPTEYSISKSNEWKYDKVTGNSFPKAQFGGGNPRELSLSLLLDSSLLSKTAHIRDVTNDVSTD